MSGKWTIDKQFSFCYGHRVWTQLLENEFCELGDYKCKCRALHGHEGLVHVFLESSKLTRSMVTDFKHLGWLKNFLDNHLDHKFVIDKHDPMFKQLVVDLYNPAMSVSDFLNCCLYPVNVPDTTHNVGWEIVTTEITDSPLKETLGGYFIVDFVPTSENFSQWLYKAVQAKMDKLGVIVSRIDWFETPKSRSSYSYEGHIHPPVTAPTF